MSNPSKTFEFLRLYPRLSADPVVGKIGEVYYNTATNTLRLCTSDSPLTWRSLGASGAKVDLYDPISTVLPSGVSAVIDGVTLVDGHTVLFSNLSFGNNRIYIVSGVGVSLSWTPVADWIAGLDPIANDRVTIRLGDGFSLQDGLFDGTSFSFHDVTRFFSGNDYWELSSLKTLNFPDNATTNAFNVNVTGSENMAIDYSVSRGATKETGTLHVTSDGTLVSFASNATYLGLTGVTFNFSITLGVLYFDVISDNSGSAGNLKYFVRRWSNSPGGPGGIPNYSTGLASPPTAAGASGDVQFNSSNLMAADANFKWDSVGKNINLNGFLMGALSAPFTLINNTTDGVIFTYPKSYQCLVLTFGINRSGSYKVGRMLIVNNGITVTFQDDSIMTVDPGVTLTAAVVGSDIEVRYTTTNTGLNANFQYSANKFSV